MRIPAGSTPRLALAALLACHAAPAQSEANRQLEVAVEVPEDVPLRAVSSDFSASEFEPRGGALVIELAGSIRFRHEGPVAVRAVTLAVDAHERMLGGRAGVAAPSLHVPRGEEFEIHLHLRMLRPLPRPPGPVVRVAADAVLFDTLASAGPDRLGSLPKMKAREMEARRDRAYFLARWQSGGRKALAEAMQASLRRQSARPRLDVRLAGDGPATAAANGTARRIQLALVQQADAPLVLEHGTALVTATATDAPRILLQNRAGAAVREFELGWLVGDRYGRVYSVGAAPLEGSPGLGPGERFETRSDGSFELRRSGDGAPLKIDSMSAYLRSAHMADGRVWVPAREALEQSRLLEAIPVSAEERRLAEIYRSRGPDALADELSRLAPPRPGTAPR